ncbi:aspartic peptidase domain-containing protein [Xylariomycetidae sp. FL0641]|nr:aspartic peptidase domain-containing protein [Xylariomycetidae sp. FL0641]
MSPATQILTYLTAVFGVVSGVRASPLLDFGPVDATSFYKAGNEVLTMPLRRVNHRGMATPSIAKRYLGTDVLGVYGAAYLAELTIGTGGTPQKVDVLIDTGSFELWVDPNCATSNVPDYCQSFGYYDPTKSSTSKALNKPYSIKYGSGSTSGLYYKDDVYISGAKISQQQFGVNNNSDLVWFGILGLGHGQQGGFFQYPLVVDSLAAQGYTNSKLFSMDLGSQPDPSAAVTGELVFGGVDTNKFAGKLVKVPTDPSDPHYKVALNSLSHNAPNGSATTIMDSSLPLSMILDSGTTLSLLPEAVVTKLAAQFPFAQSDGEGGYTVPCSSQAEDGFVNFEFLSSDSGSVTINVAYNDFIWNSGDLCYLGAYSSSDVDLYILGDSFLRGAYVAFDQTNNAVFMNNYVSCGSGNLQLFHFLVGHFHFLPNIHIFPDFDLDDQHELSHLHHIYPFIPHFHKQDFLLHLLHSTTSTTSSLTSASLPSGTPSSSAIASAASSLGASLNPIIPANPSSSSISTSTPTSSGTALGPGNGNEPGGRPSSPGSTPTTTTTNTTPNTSTLPPNPTSALPPGAPAQGDPSDPNNNTALPGGNNGAGAATTVAGAPHTTVTSTLTREVVYTVHECPPSVEDCPYREATRVEVVTTTFCPEETAVAAGGDAPEVTAAVAGSAAGEGGSLDSSSAAQNGGNVASGKANVGVAGVGGQDQGPGTPTGGESAVSPGVEVSQGGEISNSQAGEGTREGGAGGPQSAGTQGESGETTSQGGGGGSTGSQDQGGDSTPGQGLSAAPPATPAAAAIATLTTYSSTRTTTVPTCAADDRACVPGMTTTELVTLVATVTVRPLPPAPAAASSMRPGGSGGGGGGGFGDRVFNATAAAAGVANQAATGGMLLLPKPTAGFQYTAGAAGRPGTTTTTTGCWGWVGVGVLVGAVAALV